MARCMFPYSVERKLYFNQEARIVPVPCGKCPNCLKRRLAGWSFRLEVESLNWEKQFFVTLTYNTNHVPITTNGFLTLQKGQGSHLTNFLKRLRQRAGKLRYYACGEYGTQNKRPHYHLILFGNSNMEEADILDAWTHPTTKESFGDVHFGKVETASINYTVQYFDKGDWLRAHKRDDRVPEFSVMSKGIGSTWLTPQMAKHLIDNPDKAFIYNREGKKIAIPRYFKNRLYDMLLPSPVVANHPSILLYRDEMLAAKEVHHQAVADIMKDIELEPDTAETNENRRMAIINYRESKRKIRK